MKILFLAPDVFRESGGIARYCRLMYKAMIGHPDITKIDVISLWDSPSDTPENLDPRTKYYSCDGSRARFICAAITLATKQYDLCIVGHVNFSPLGQVIKLISGASCITMAYGVDVWDRLPDRRQKSLVKADLILAISEYTRQRMVESNNVDFAKVKILYNCFDPELLSQFSANDSSHCKNLLLSPNLITVARLGEEDSYKGHREVISALPQVLEKIPNVNYYIIGKGSLTEKLKNLSIELKVTDHVHFLGFLSNEELKCAYQQCDVFIMPSRKEGFGFVFAEAMMYGKPVIAGNEDASVEVVENKVTGLLVRPQDEKQIADAIICLLSDSALRQEMGKKGREVALAKFSFAEFSQTLMKHVYEVGKH